MAKTGKAPSTKPMAGMGGGKPAAVSKPPNGAGAKGGGKPAGKGKGC